MKQRPSPWWWILVLYSPVIAFYAAHYAVVFTYPGLTPQGFGKYYVAQTTACVYSFKVLPWLGERVAQDGEAYRYLAESIRMHPDQETLRNMMERAGLERVEYFNLTAGVVALHRGYRL